ncbi:MAG: type II toxin-antitoxin system VapC family toxin [Nocardioides sp.]|uniref:type II toxin-antitoxin system VapC family toxin n=1 Tax=Nocardioides sp. TaxID=35761 RepID=UPI0039E3F37C
MRSGRGTRESGMILVDTSVLVHAVGAEHPLREPGRALIEAVGAGTVAATTTVEVLQEFAHVRAQRRTRADAARLTRAYAALFDPLLRVDAEDLDIGLRLFTEHARLGCLDAVLAAASMRRQHITGIASADSAFGAVAEVTWHDLGDPDLGSILGLSV